MRATALRGSPLRSCSCRWHAPRSRSLCHAAAVHLSAVLAAQDARLRNGGAQGLRVPLEDAAAGGPPGDASEVAGCTEAGEGVTLPCSTLRTRCEEFCSALPLNLAPRARKVLEVVEWSQRPAGVAPSELCCSSLDAQLECAD
jgi:hypothetical protein